jgi:hypothetical protein
MCYILCMTRSSVCVALGMRGGFFFFFGGGGGGGGLAPLSGGFRGSALEKKKWRFFTYVFGGFSTHGFLILVKELGSLNNPGQWIMDFG